MSSWLGFLNQLAGDTEGCFSELVTHTQRKQMISVSTVSIIDDDQSSVCGVADFNYVSIFMQEPVFFNIFRN